jgi:hypothetical protein
LTADILLADLVAPQSADDFLDQVYSRSWALYRGDEYRFDCLADWEALNSLLVTLKFESPRFRVARKGQLVPPEEYTEEIQMVNQVGQPSYRRILVEKLVHELAVGATLTLDRVDQAHIPIGKLAAVLENQLKAPVYANLFASWAAIPGFDVHWDNQDVFALQLRGRKHWKVYEPTRLWPLVHDTERALEPDGHPVAEFDLTPGDVLYLPHGWWHSVSAIDEPSLHLTIGFIPSTGIDLMNWVVDQAKSDELFRRRLPRFADADEQARHVSRMRSILMERLEASDILDQFFTYIDGISGPRPRLGLPDLLTTNSVLARRSARIVLIATRATVSSTEDGLVLSALGKRWKFSSATMPLIEEIISPGLTTVADAVAANIDVAEEKSAEVIFTLLRAGIVALQ